MSCKIIEKIKGFADCLWQLIFGDDRDIIEKRVCDLEKKVQDLEQRCNQEHAKIAPPIVIEQFYVERIVVDKVEHTNNFGSLGIRELSGMLNIGANYGIGTAPKGKEKKDLDTQPPVKEGKEEKKKKQSHQGTGPKLTINYKETPGGKQADKNGKTIVK